MVPSSGYACGYRARGSVWVLVIEPRVEALEATVARYLPRCSFAMAALPAVVATAATLFVFHGIVLSPHLDGDDRMRVVAAMSPQHRLFEVDDPAVVCRELWGVGQQRRARATQLLP